MKLTNCIVLRYDNANKVSKLLNGMRNLKQIRLEENIGLAQITDGQNPAKVTDKLEGSHLFNHVDYVRNFRVE